MGDSAGVQEVLEKPGKHSIWLGGALLEHPATEPVRASSIIRVYSAQDGCYQMLLSGGVGGESWGL